MFKKAVVLVLFCGSLSAQYMTEQVTEKLMINEFFRCINALDVKGLKTCIEKYPGLAKKPGLNINSETPLSALAVHLIGANPDLIPVCGKILKQLLDAGVDVNQSCSHHLSLLIFLLCPLFETVSPYYIGGYQERYARLMEIKSCLHLIVGHKDLDIDKATTSNQYVISSGRSLVDVLNDYHREVGLGAYVDLLSLFLHLHPENKQVWNYIMPSMIRLQRLSWLKTMHGTLKEQQWLGGGEGDLLNCFVRVLPSGNLTKKVTFFFLKRLGGTTCDPRDFKFSGEEQKELDRLFVTYQFLQEQKLKKLKSYFVHKLVLCDTLQGKRGFHKDIVTLIMPFEGQ